MATNDSSIGIDESLVTFGDQASVDADAQSSATSSASSVDGIAVGAAVISNGTAETPEAASVGVLDSTITVGADATIDIDETGLADADAGTINKQSQSIGAGTGAADVTGVSVGDLLIDGSGNAVGYVRGVGSGSATGASDDEITWAATPGGAVVGSGSDASSLNSAGYEVVAASTFAGFRGATGGMIDGSGTSGNSGDVVVGDNATITVDAGNLADADATNVDGDAYAAARVSETFGLESIQMTVGDSGSLTVNADADALATAVTVGDPTATSVGSGSTMANANADADATSVVGISDLGSGSGQFSFGNDASVIAQAGGTADRVTVGADADTETGDAIANAASTVVAGIQDNQDGNVGSTANQLSVGDNGTIKGTAFTDFDASADTTSGIADADVSVGSTGSGDAGVFGVQVDEIVVGNGGVVQGQAGSLIDVSANTVQGIGTNAGTANADALLNKSVGLSAEELTVGNDALLEGSYGVLGRVDADLVVGASSVGSGTADSAMADGQVNLVKGLELGDGTDVVPDTALSIGNNATVAGVADVTNAATATSVDGNTEAVAKVGADDGTATGDSAIGIDLNDAMEVGQDATILANALVDLDATATTQAGVGSGSGTTIAGAGAELVVGLDIDMGDNDISSIGADGSITALGQVSADATATSVEAAATANVGALNAGLSNASKMRVVGLQTNETLVIGDGGTIDADANSTLNATASSVTADGNANANVLENVGLDVDATGSAALTVGSSGIINGEANLAATATANSIDASATTNVNANDNRGVDSEGAISIGSTDSLTGTADLDLSSTAETVGDDAATDQASATTFFMNNVGLDIDAAGTTIGANGTVVGDADFDGSATALGVTADAMANMIQFDNTTAIDLGGPSSGQILTIGDAGTITANSRVGNTASATTTDGKATASISGSLTSGLGDGEGSAIVGSNATIDADAMVTNTATATTIDSDSNDTVRALDTSRLVEAINLTSITAGDNLSLDADASSSQTATASNVGDDGDTETVEATVAGSSGGVKGITSTTITVGDDASQLTTSAEFTGETTASNVNSTGDAQAFSALTGLHVSGLENSSNVTVGGSLTGGLTATGTTTLTANATGIDGGAVANAGDTFLSVDITGIQSSDITVGDDAGTITGRATGTFNASASSTSDTANAKAGGELDGVTDSTVTIGDDGNLTAVGTAVANATATTVGDATTDTAAATTDLHVHGLDQDHEVVTIGSTGNVIGQAFASGDTTSTSVAGGATSSSDVDVAGIEDMDGDDITIGEAGTINGLGVIGTLTSEGAFDQQVKVTATSTDESANAEGDYDAWGIYGDGGSTDYTAGPNDGDVIGQAMAGAQVNASTVGLSSSTAPNATATIGGTTSSKGDVNLAGIQDLDILGGMVGTNTIKGTAFGDFDANAQSVAGDATGYSDVDAYGIFDSDNDGTVSLSGNIEAIAQLTNTVTARTIEGNATATATGDAIGLGGYSINIIGNGAITASADSDSSSFARSVSGRAGA